KAVQRDKAIPIVADKYGIDPKIAKDRLLHEQHMSDEYSGPEDRDETSQAVWRTKMAYEAGYDKVPDSVLAKTDFVEVAETPWRSEKLRRSILSPGHKKKFRLVRVRDTGRAPSDIPARRHRISESIQPGLIESEQPTTRRASEARGGRKETEQVQINADINDISLLTNNLCLFGLSACGQAHKVKASRILC
ncbi:hypothetical protein B0H14DRAFT_2635340, partial [Mycena olivaceomarginata]